MKNFSWLNPAVFSAAEVLGGGQSDGNPPAGGQSNGNPAGETGGAGGGNQPPAPTIITIDLGKQPQGVQDLFKAKGWDKPEAGDLVANSYFHANKALSGAADVIALPGADATEEQLNTFYGKLGRPEKADGYEFKFEDGIEVHDGFKSWAQGTFHKHGISAKQATAIVNDWQAFVKQAGADMNTKTAAAEQADIGKLKTEHGANYDTFIADGQKAFKALGLPPEVSDKIEAAAGTYGFVWLMSALGKKMGGEGGFISGNSGTTADPSGMSPEQASAEITKLQTDAEFVKRYNDPRHPEHKTALAKMEALFKAKAGAK